MIFGCTSVNSPNLHLLSWEKILFFFLFFFFCFLKFRFTNVIKPCTVPPIIGTLYLLFDDRFVMVEIVLKIA